MSKTAFACDILNLEWSSTGRDADIVEPVLCHLELFDGLRVIRDGITDYASKLLKHRPRMLLISNTGGARRNVKVVKAARALGCLVVSLISEGDYLEDPEAVSQSFWGWNREQVQYEDLRVEWSERVVALIHRHVAGLDPSRIAFAGATGFDRYRLFDFMGKGEFLRKYGKPAFTRVIGIGGYGFDLMFGDYFESHRAMVEKWTGEAYLPLHRQAMFLVRDWLDRLIREHPDVLFVLKHHPGAVSERDTELYGLDRHPNTVTLRKNEENISDILSACDCWLAYDSTTCLEAWLLGKPTALLNPLGGDFKRSRIAAGSPQFFTYAGIRDALDDYLRTGTLPGFEALRSRRERIVRQIIQWDDGDNHRRTAALVAALLERAPARPLNPWHPGILGPRLVEGLVNAGLGILAARPGPRIPWLDPLAKAYRALVGRFVPAERRRLSERYRNRLWHRAKARAEARGAGAA